MLHSIFTGIAVGSAATLVVLVFGALLMTVLVMGFWEDFFGNRREAALQIGMLLLSIGICILGWIRAANTASMWSVGNIILCVIVALVTLALLIILSNVLDSLLRLEEEYDRRKRGG
jgi:MFS family permease